MNVEKIHDLLGVVLVSTNDVALVLLRLEGRGGEASLNTCISPIETRLHSIYDVFLAELILVAHLDDRLLSLAAAILESLSELEVAREDSIDNLLSIRVSLSSQQGNTLANIADSTLEGVEIAIEVTSKLVDSKVNSLDRIHDEVGVLVVLHLGSDCRKLVLYLGILQALPMVAPHTVSEHHPYEIDEWVVVPVVCTSVESSGHGHRISLILLAEECIQSIITVTITVDLFQ
nr:MAG TPA: hypothetical protein [Caudoviricetes sp.]